MRVQRKRVMKDEVVDHRLPSSSSSSPSSLQFRADTVSVALDTDFVIGAAPLCQRNVHHIAGDFGLGLPLRCRDFKKLVTEKVPVLLSTGSLVMPSS
uniref:Uncharacterized protein n=1 Tax=Anguilla anguilla TaxID=7936 RepID=A0A0E9WWY5_ANGAN